MQGRKIIGECDSKELQNDYCDIKIMSLQLYHDNPLLETQQGGQGVKDDEDDEEQESKMMSMMRNKKKKDTIT